MTRAILLLAATVLLAPAAQAADLQMGVDAFQRGDYDRARYELEPLANAGDPMAQYVIGYMHALGHGVRRDDVQAHKWLSLSAAQGHRDAAEARNQLATRMSRTQVAEAERLATTFRPTPLARGNTGSSWAQAPTTTPAAAPSGASTGRAQVASIQSGLARLGYDPGPADGLMGSRTRQAISQFQRENGLIVDGQPSESLLAAIHKAQADGRRATPPSRPATPAVAAAAASPWLFNPPAKQSVDPLIDELAALLAERDDKALRKGVERIVDRLDWPWTVQVFSDDFSTGAAQGGLDWRVVSGEFAIQNGLVSDARARSAGAAAPAPATETPPADRSPESQVIGILGAILSDRLNRNRDTSEPQAPAAAPAAGGPPDRIQLLTLIDSRFLLRTRLQVDDPGKGMDLTLFRTQGGRDEELRLRFDPASSQLVMEHATADGARWLASAPVRLADRRLHAVEWASARDGTLRVAMDGEILIDDAPGAPGGVFHGFAWRNHGGRYVMTEVEMLSARAR